MFWCRQRAFTWTVVDPKDYLSVILTESIGTNEELRIKDPVRFLHLKLKPQMKIKGGVYCSSIAACDSNICKTCTGEICTECIAGYSLFSGVNLCQGNVWVIVVYPCHLGIFILSL